jgi:hypothetical protein
MIDVYCHTSPSGKCYVGYSKHGMAERWLQHVEAAGYGGNYLIHHAIRKYGAAAFKHELLEQCDTEAAAKLAEVRWIAQRGTVAPTGYNATAGGEGVVGLRCKATTRERLRQANLGRKLSPESIAKRTAKQRIIPRTAEWCANISRAHTGKKLSEAHVAAVRESLAAPERRAQIAEQMRRVHAGRHASGYWTPERRAVAAEHARLAARSRRRAGAPVPLRIAPAWGKS